MPKEKKKKKNSVHSKFLTEKSHEHGEPIRSKKLGKRIRHKRKMERKLKRKNAPTRVQ